MCACVSFHPSIRIMACAVTQKYSAAGYGRCLSRQTSGDEAERGEPRNIHTVVLRVSAFIVRGLELSMPWTYEGKHLKVFLHINLEIKVFRDR